MSLYNMRVASLRVCELRVCELRICESASLRVASLRVESCEYGVNSWTKSSIRHVERHVVTFRVRRNFAIRQRSNSSRRLPSLTSRVSLRCVAHFTRCICFDALHVFSTRRAYLFDASCVPLRRVVHTQASSTRRVALRRDV